jgi:hypothetical protein
MAFVVVGVVVARSFSKALSWACSAEILALAVDSEVSALLVWVVNFDVLRETLRKKWHDKTLEVPMKMAKEYVVSFIR